MGFNSGFKGLIYVFDLISLKSGNYNAVIYIIVPVSVLSLLSGLIGLLYILFVILFVGNCNTNDLDTSSWPFANWFGSLSFSTDFKRGMCFVDPRRGRVSL